MKNVVSQEGHQQKAFDGAGIMLEDVIGVWSVNNLRCGTAEPNGQNGQVGKRIVRPDALSLP